ncbi:response regulator [Arenibaculum pallidiluteum]|uniref:response regulator n=1 Tax=Arenibaculum pallidiluteum TaxID=2812559 RepID=UPI001A97A390|nr:response regulator transcription factor [Arenibaculum pallidiluteum]
MAKILVVDDEPQIRKFLRISLGATGYEVLEAADGRSGVAAALSDGPDLVMLDLGLPDLDGQEAITAIRAASDVPILVLSVRAEETDKVEALDRGADDYVVKPFGIGELLARVRACLRSRRRDARPGQVRFGDVTVDLARRIITRGGAEIRLTRREYELLALLAGRPGHVLTHGQILREVWGKAHEKDTAYLRVYVNQLRQKLEPDPGHPVLIVTEPGIGYRLRVSEEEA